MRFKTSILLVCCTLFLVGQTTERHQLYNYGGNFEVNKVYFVCDDVVEIYSSSDTTSKVLGTISFQDKVQVLKAAEYGGKLLKVKFNDVIGFMQAKSLAVEKKELNNYKYYFSNDDNSVFINWIGPNDIRRQTKVTAKEDVNAAFIVTLRSNVGLNGLINVLEVVFDNESCGLVFNNFYLFQTKDELKKIFIAEGGDGIIGNNFEYLVFPADSGGIAGHVVLVSEGKSVIEWYDEQLEVNLYKESEKMVEETQSMEQIGKGLEELEIQPRTKDYYFKAIIRTNYDLEGPYRILIGLEVFSIETENMVQFIPVDSNFNPSMDVGLMIYDFEIGDYNFDGIMDFSIGASIGTKYATKYYFLKNEEMNTFFLSSFNGNRLQFDINKKRIYEHQKYGMMSTRDIIYKVLNNEMVQISETCKEWDERLEDFVQVDCD